MAGSQVLRLVMSKGVVYTPHINETQLAWFSVICDQKSENQPHGADNLSRCYAAIFFWMMTGLGVHVYTTNYSCVPAWSTHATMDLKLHVGFFSYDHDETYDCKNVTCLCRASLHQMQDWQSYIYIYIYILVWG